MIYSQPRPQLLPAERKPMPVRELAHTTKTTSEKPRGRIRIQLDTPPKKQRGVRAWPVFGRKFWSKIWRWYVADRDFWATVFYCITIAGFVAFFGVYLIVLLVVAALGIKLDVALPWVMGIPLGGFGVALVCWITFGLLHTKNK